MPNKQMLSQQHIRRDQFHKQIRRKQIQSIQRTRRCQLQFPLHESTIISTIVYECTIQHLLLQGSNYLQLLKQAIVTYSYTSKQLTILLHNILQYLPAIVSNYKIPPSQCFDHNSWQILNNTINLNGYFSLLNAIMFQSVPYYPMQRIIQLVLSALNYTICVKEILSKQTLLSVLWNISYFQDISLFLKCHVFQDIQTYIMDYGFTLSQKQAIISMYSNSIAQLVMEGSNVFLSIFKQLLDVSDEQSKERLVQSAIQLLKSGLIQIRRETIECISQLSIMTHINGIDRLFVALAHNAINQGYITEIEQRLLIRFLYDGVKCRQGDKYYTLKDMLKWCDQLMHRCNKIVESVFSTVFQLYMIDSFQGCEGEIMDFVEQYLCLGNTTTYNEELKEMMITIEISSFTCQNYMRMVGKFISVRPHNQQFCENIIDKIQQIGYNEDQYVRENINDFIRKIKYLIEQIQINNHKIS